MYGGAGAQSLLKAGFEGQPAVKQVQCLMPFSGCVAFLLLKSEIHTVAYIVLQTQSKHDYNYKIK